MKKALIWGSLLLVAVSSSRCLNECSNSSVGLYVQFFITDKTTGRPYYAVSRDKADSLRIYQDEYPTSTNVQREPFITKVTTNPDQDYGFGIVDIYSVEKTILYFQFNRTDIDTVLLSAQVSRGAAPCFFYKSVVTAFYNGRLVKTINSDTTGLMNFRLLK